MKLVIGIGFKIGFVPKRNNKQTAFTNVRNNTHCITDFYNNIELDVSYASTYIFRSDR